MIDREVREATDLYSLVSQYVPLKRRGHVAVGSCPFHDERTPSFRVNLHGHRYAGRYKCFGCDAKGDAIDFLVRIEGIPQFEAVKRLAEDAGISVPERSNRSPRRSQRLADMDRCLWWHRDRWKAQRSALDALLASGPPVPGTAEFSRAENHGQLMRYLEANQRNVEESVRGWTARDADRYRAHLRSKIGAGIRVSAFMAGKGSLRAADSSALVAMSVLV